VIAEVVGVSFPVDHVGLPSLDEMRQGIYARPSDTEPLDQNQSYPFIILAESNLASLVQDALISGIAVDATARWQAKRAAGTKSSAYRCCSIP